MKTNKVHCIFGETSDQFWAYVCNHFTLLFIAPKKEKYIASTHKEKLVNSICIISFQPAS